MRVFNFTIKVTWDTAVIVFTADIFGYIKQYLYTITVRTEEPPSDELNRKVSEHLIREGTLFSVQHEIDKTKNVQVSLEDIYFEAML